MFKSWVFLNGEKELSSPAVIYIGCMTGTSVDNQADFTAAAFDKTGLPIAYKNHAITIPAELQCQLLELSKANSDDISIIKRSHVEAIFTQFLVTAYRSVIESLELLHYPKAQIVLSPHGQAINHQPYANPPYSDILINGDMLAHQTGCRVVTRHRQAPLVVSAAAPLAPILIKKLFSSTIENTILLNGGGIANICVLLKDQPKKIVACDTGPANGPLDEIVQYVLTNEPEKTPVDLKDNIIANKFDVDGRWAKQGKL
ncbi:unnamed protein product, partial [marine sediment metagenome]